MDTPSLTSQYSHPLGHCSMCAVGIESSGCICYHVTSFCYSQHHQAGAGDALLRQWCLVQGTSPGADWARQITCSACPSPPPPTWGRGGSPHQVTAPACPMSPEPTPWAMLPGIPCWKANTPWARAVEAWPFHLLLHTTSHGQPVTAPQSPTTQPPAEAPAGTAAEPTGVGVK